MTNAQMRVKEINETINNMFEAAEKNGGCTKEYFAFLMNLQMEMFKAIKE